MWGGILYPIYQQGIKPIFDGIGTSISAETVKRQQTDNDEQQYVIEVMSNERYYPERHSWH
jgi:hypothetical protein